MTLMIMMMMNTDNSRKILLNHTHLRHLRSIF